MKRILRVILTIFFVVLLVGCVKDEGGNEETTNDGVEIYYLNDLHGAILNEENNLGLSQIGNLILDEKENNNKTTLAIAGGDMLQGQMISNYFNGEPVISLMNEIGFDCFVIGNHEFDWGLDKVLGYFDGTSHLQANFPLLGANVYYKDTNQRPEGIEPYTIINKDGYKIAIIGVIGDGLESSIAASRVSDYYFADAKEEVTKQLVTVKAQDPDLIVVVNHAQDESFNNSISRLGVDVVFNGHSHRMYVEYLNSIPVVQSGSSGQYVGYVAFGYLNDKLTFLSVKNYTAKDKGQLNYSNQALDQIIAEYYEVIRPQIENVILRSGSYYSTGDLSQYIAYLMAQQSNSDVGIHNYGGTRTSLDSDEAITVAKIWQILPFDNVVVTCQLTGYEINYLLSNSSLAVYSEISSFEPNTYYSVAVNDYVFGNYNNFNGAINEELTDLVLRDIFLNAVNQQATTSNYFSITAPYLPIRAYQHLYKQLYIN